jgi:voltage-gated potassium channel
LGLKEDEILDAVAISDKFRLINLSSTATPEERVTDLLAVEHFPVNTVYGQCIDRKSKVTIFSPSNIVDPIIGWWAYYLAKIGGFNYVSREVGETRPYNSFYLYKNDGTIGREECMADLNRLVDSEDKWVFSILAASGGSEPAYPTQFHFTYGAKKGDETYDDPNITLNNIPAFDALYNEFATLLETDYSLSADRQRYHTNANAAYFARHLEHKVNAVALRVAWSVTVRDARAIQIAQSLAQSINQKINHTYNPVNPELKIKAIGYEGYTE